MKQTIVLIPGAYSKAAEPIFNAIKKSLAKTDYEILILESADEKNFTSKAGKIKSKILVGKSYGGKVAIEYQLKHNDAKALVLLAPAAEANNQYKEIKIPVLIVHAVEDQVIPIENSKEIRKLFDNCKLVEIQGTDHGYRGKELETAKIIADWISSLHS